MSKELIGEALRGAVHNLALGIPVNFELGQQQATTGNRLDFAMEWLKADTKEGGHSRIHKARLRLTYWPGKKLMTSVEQDLDAVERALSNKTFQGVFVGDMDTQTVGTGRRLRFPVSYSERLL